MNETTTLPQPLDDLLVRTLHRQLVRYAAGQHIFCKACHQVLDCRSTVVSEWKYTLRRNDGREEQRIMATLVFCAKCHDALFPRILQTFEQTATEFSAKLAAVNPGSAITHPVCEVIDGRSLWRRKGGGS